MACLAEYIVADCNLQLHRTEFWRVVANDVAPTTVTGIENIPNVDAGIGLVQTPRHLGDVVEPMFLFVR